jgi:two-component system nitrate/nitrite response regulator NarL
MAVPPIRVLVVDDHEVFRRGVVSVLGQYPQVQVVGEAGDGGEAVAVARRTRPDVVLLDLRMPGVDGLSAIPRLRQLDPPPRILVLTVSEQEADLLAAIRAGADGYLLKDLRAGTLLERIEEVARGGVALSASMARRLWEGLRGTGARPGPAAQPPAPSLPEEPPAELRQLTPREREVLELVADGRTNAEIAAALYLSEQTVKTHVQNILGKLQLRNRTEAALLAQRYLRSRGGPDGPRQAAAPRG